jgi:hypothetical protein
MDLLSVVSHELGHALGQAHNDASAGMIPALQSGVRQLPAEHSGEQPIDAATQAAILESIDVDIVGFGTMDLVDVSRAQVSAPLMVNLPRMDATEDADNEVSAVVSNSAVPVSAADTANTTEFAVLEELPLSAESTGQAEPEAVIPEIEWEMPTVAAVDTVSTPQSAQSDNWIKDFVLNLAEDTTVKPNDELEVGLPEEAIAPVTRKEEE